MTTSGERRFIMINNGIVKRFYLRCCRRLILIYIHDYMEAYLAAPTPQKYGTYSDLAALKDSLEIITLDPRTMGAIYNRLANIGDKLGVNDDCNS